MSDDYWNAVRPTYIENWAPVMYSLSIPQVDIPMMLEETEALGTNIMELYELFPKPHFRSIGALIQRVDEAVKVFKDGAFVRLGSRSPKDVWIQGPNGFKVYSGEEAIALLTGVSERIADDLLLALKYRYPAHIFVREWQDIPKWAEFRCFMKDRRLVGISQYQYLDGKFKEIEEHHDGIEWAIHRFFDTQFKEASHLDSIIFDVFVKMRKSGGETNWQVKLLEVNPNFPLTDPTLFFGHKGFDGSFKYVKNNEG